MDVGWAHWFLGLFFAGHYPFLFFILLFVSTEKLLRTSRKDTKIMLNSIRPKLKKSHMEQGMSVQVIVIFAVLLVFCLFASIYNTVFTSAVWEEKYYLGYEEKPNVIENLFTRMGTWILIFG